MVMQKKTSMGRQRITMKKISKKSNLQVTFSKRRAGLFKKASELCTLCGVDIAIIVFSPAAKAFSFSHPNIDSIINRFDTQTPPLYPKTFKLLDANRNAYIHELNVELTQLLNQLEEEKKHGEGLDQFRKDGEKQYWWKSSISELRLHQLEQLKVAMEELKKKVAQQANKILVESPNFSPFLGFASLRNTSNFGYGHQFF